MKRLDFVTLRLFVAIADERSLTRAAEREHLALAAVSKRISDLEDQIGISLLYRRPRGIELTPAGHAFLHHARLMLEGLSRLDADMSEYSVGIKGHIRLHANTSSVIEFLPDDLGDFMDRFPQIRIDMKERLSHEIVTAVRDGLADIGLYAGHVPAEGLDARLWRRDRLVLVVPQGHPLAGEAAVALEQALDNDFIGLEQDASLQALLQNGARRFDRPLRMRIQVRSFEGICRMIDRGMGIGVLPCRAVNAERHGLRLVAVPLTDGWALRELHLVMRDHHALAVPARQLVDHLLRCGARDRDDETADPA
ncbi:LysR family transcriptional regulator [Kushneria indalinina]|uniref:DNA-binding transcriptional LysR family regulator n=1 Tax=Kushneria indalinina DSM 14324 TaxID=1122140 RepID=A0A3D9DSZ0_9GAMM|nr:LysR family transcriptional regulator [Kushneria indalinina]REC93775.1 DNA-binding transcriptional LysR family regulator [Kushneria indalinina DSM 14324]